MKLLNFSFLFSLLFLLSACAPSSLDDEAYDDWRHSLGNPERSDMKYGGNTVITKEKQVQQIDPAVVHVAKTQGDYMEVMARQFRQDLLSTGSQVKQDGTKVWVYMPVQSVFGSNQVTIKPSVEPALKAMVKNLNNHPETMIRVIGHTDNSMGVVPSKEFSLRQATAFANYLHSKGVNSERILAEGYGSSDPIANNQTAAGRIKNRYIEIIVYNLQ